jgi:glutamate-1-semialdehyde aminotransferase
MSKGPSQWARGYAPAFVERAEGARVWDVDGNEYLDFPMALGPVILGHGYPAVSEAIVRQLRDGITYTLPHRIEVEVAERLERIIPGLERVRFGKTGSDATSAAIRVARAVTGRDHVIVAGYHGWHDWYIASTSRRRGVPDVVAGLAEAVPAGDLEALRSAFEARPGEIAAVIVEPAGAREPEPSELAALVDLTREHGALAVFDEIVTGLRLALGGAQEHYGVEADLVCLGKALGNGMPISALAGKARHMDVLEQVFFSGTHGGEALSLAAAGAVIDVMEREPVHDHLWRLGGRLQDGVRDAIAAHGLDGWASCGGPHPLTVITVREPRPDGDGLPAKTLVQQELLRRGILYNGSHLISYAHTEDDIRRTVAAYHEVFELLASALPDDVERHLEGPPVAPVFRSL